MPRVDDGLSRPEAAGDLVALDVGGLSAEADDLPHELEVPNLDEITHLGLPVELRQDQGSVDPLDGSYQGHLYHSQDLGHLGLDPRPDVIKITLESVVVGLGCYVIPDDNSSCYVNGVIL